MNRKLILSLCTIFTASTLISTYSVSTYADTPSTYETTENPALSSETIETSETEETAGQPDNADITISNTAETITPEDASSTGTIPSIENIPEFSVSNEKSLISSHAYTILF